MYNSNVQLSLVSYPLSKEGKPIGIEFNYWASAFLPIGFFRMIPKKLIRKIVIHKQGERTGRGRMADVITLFNTEEFVTWLLSNKPTAWSDRFYIHEAIQLVQHMVEIKKNIAMNDLLVIEFEFPRTQEERRRELAEKKKARSAESVSNGFRKAVLSHQK